MNDRRTIKIILKHTLTIFNLVNLILALMIISVGSYKNLLFIFVAIFNTLISIINELRAKRTIDKMRLLSEKQPTIIKNDKTYRIPAEDIKKGDLLLLSLGDQILVDCKIVSGDVEVNESFITGESDNTLKHPGDELLSGSFIVSGSCQAEATSTLENSFVKKLISSAKTIKTADSKLFTIMNNIVKYISYTLIPIGILLLWARFRVPGTTTEVAITSTVAALINMIPEGLVLLTSSVLALATIRLSKEKVLVQDLYSIETLARVDCIALDKTGTLTTGKMTVEDFISAENHTEKSLKNALESILSASSADNATSIALKAKLGLNAKISPLAADLEPIPFSSERKYSGVKTKTATFLMGAPEFLLKDKSDLKLASDLSTTSRVLAVVKETDKESELLGFVTLKDEIRRDARKIIDFFNDNNVKVRLISGDSLNTVKRIADSVGLIGKRAVDLSTIKEKNYKTLVEDYELFTRVTPSEKKSLIKALKAQGNTVAMTGDGVNDILAMKEADVSIAIGEGSDAARRSAKLVLLSSDFAAVPSIIAEGRRSINNLERSAALFLSKTVFASILAVIFVILPFEYPFSPIEMSLLNFLCIGFPGLILALENNTERVKNRFVKNIKRYSIPTGIAISVAMLTLSILASVYSLPRSELTIISSLITFLIDLFLIYQISKPLNYFRAGLIFVIIALFALSLLLPFARNFIFII